MLSNQSMTSRCSVIPAAAGGEDAEAKIRRIGNVLFHCLTATTVINKGYSNKAQNS